MNDERGEGFYRERYDQYRQELAGKEAAERERWGKVEPLIEDIALAASYMPEFESIVQGAANRLEAMQNVQLALPEHFPQLAKLPRPDVAGVASNEFKAAKEIVRLLWKEPVR